MASTILSVLQRAYIASLLRDSRRYSRAIRKPADIQSRKLDRVLAKNAATVYGSKLGFSGISSIAEFRKKVPVVGYDDIEPYIQQICAGYQNVLTSDPVMMLERSGGSTSTTKYIPYTQALLNEFSAATNPWLHNLYTRIPGLIGTKSYWSVSPVSHNETTTSGGVPVGFEEETEYFNPVAKWSLEQMLCVPSSVRHITCDREWKHQTCRHLLQEKNLGFISVWSPTFLLALMEYIQANTDALAEDLPRDARRRLYTAIDRSRSGVNGETLWPNLKVISCWSDGISADFSTRLRDYFPEVFIQGKGLLATEGVITIPLDKTPQDAESDLISHGGVLAVNSHFYEFIDLNNESAAPRLAHELERGGVYSPIITTSGGLYRYHLKDIVECTGFRRNTPELTYVNKLDRVSDLCGEKIHANQADKAIKLASRETGINTRFALIAPRKKPPLHYTLFIESDGPTEKLKEFTTIVEQYLETGHHYSYCRQRGQLGPMDIQPVKEGWKQYQEHLSSKGQRIGDIKPTHLDARYDWHQVFSLRSSKL